MDLRTSTEIMNEERQSKIQQVLLATLVSSIYYDDMSHYHKNEQISFDNVLTIPSGWSSHQQGPWQFLNPSKGSLPEQGWKIHVSARETDLVEILTKCSRYCFEHGIPFKYNCDTSVFRLFNYKIWPRGNAGKFVTIYPCDEASFRTILDDLRPVLAAYEGPYILSDKRYMDSKVLYYRYGQIKSTYRIGIRGERIPVLAAPGGPPVSDHRLPYFALPYWVDDLFPDPPQEESPAFTLNIMPAHSPS